MQFAALFRSAGATQVTGAFKGEPVALCKATWIGTKVLVSFIVSVKEKSILSLSILYMTLILRLALPPPPSGRLHTRRRRRTRTQPSKVKVLAVVASDRDDHSFFDVNNHPSSFLDTSLSLLVFSLLHV